MSYANTGLKLVQTGVSGGPNLWNYTSADARTSVEGAGYFSDGTDFGMKLGDTVIVVYTTGYVTTIHSVSAVSGTACTINAAVLS